MNKSDDGIKPDDEIKQRGQWSKGLEFLLSCISMSVGLGNVWRFPFAAYSNGGGKLKMLSNVLVETLLRPIYSLGAFLIPYLLLLFIIGRPMYYMELILGQFSGKGPIKVWKCVPALKGIGFAQLASTSYLIIFYNYLMALTLYYLFASFSSSLPWTVCDPEWCTNGLNDNQTASLLASPSNPVVTAAISNFSTNISSLSLPSASALSTALEVEDDVLKHSIESEFPDEYEHVNMSLTQQYWLNHVLKQSRSLSEITWLNWRLALCLVLSWISVYLSIIRGVASLGKVAYFTALFPYFVLIALLFASLNADGAWNGILYFLNPQWSLLLDPIVWYRAVEQSFFSLGVCFGTLIMYSSYNDFKNNVYRDAIIISVLDTFTSLLAGCVIFAVLGTMAHQQNVQIKDVVKEGMGLAFVVYPDALSKIGYAPQVWSILFFFMLFTLGIGSSVAQIETILTAIRDEFTALRNKKGTLAFVTCFLFCLCGLPLTTNAGQHIMKLLDNYGVGTAVFLYGILQTIGVMWIYGLRRFCNDVKFMLNKSVGLFWKITWGFTAPVSLIAIFLYGNIQLFQEDKPDPAIPDWGRGIGWALAAVAVFQIPLWIVLTIYKFPGSFSQKVKKAFTPSADWGPAVPQQFKAWLEWNNKRQIELEHTKYHVNHAYVHDNTNNNVISKNP